MERVRCLRAPPNKQGRAAGGTGGRTVRDGRWEHGQRGWPRALGGGNGWEGTYRCSGAGQEEARQQK